MSEVKTQTEPGPDPESAPDTTPAIKGGVCADKGERFIGQESGKSAAGEELGKRGMPAQISGLNEVMLEVGDLQSK